MEANYSTAARRRTRPADEKRQGFQDMLEEVFRPVARGIGSTVGFLQEVLGFMDSPGTYLLWTVVGLIYIPFFVKSVYEQYANPHGYYAIPLVRKSIMGTVFIGAWLLFGYANFIRFLPPA
jgi:hypothetical protein